VGNLGLRSTPTAFFTAEYAEDAEQGREDSVASGFIPDGGSVRRAVVFRPAAPAFVGHKVRRYGKAVADKLRRYDLLGFSVSSVASARNAGLAPGVAPRSKRLPCRWHGPFPERAR